MAYADIAIDYSITKGVSQMLSFPVVKVGDGQRKTHYDPKEIGGFLETATSVQVNSIMGLDGSFAYQDANNAWHGLLREINPSRGYYVNFAGTGTAATYTVNFTDSDATTSKNKGENIAGEDYFINKLSTYNPTISYPFNSDESWSDVWNDPNGTYVTAVECQTDSSTTLSASYSGGSWSGTLVTEGFKRGRGYKVTLASVIPFPERLELFKYGSSSTSGGKTIARMTSPTGSDNKVLAKIKLSTNFSFLLFVNDGTPNTQGLIDPYGMPIGKGSRVFAYDNSDDSNLFGTLLSPPFDDVYYPSLVTDFQGYQGNGGFENGAEQVGVCCMGSDATTSGYDNAETVKYRCWDSRSGKFFNVRWKDDSGNVINETFTSYNVTLATGASLTTFTD